MTAFFNPQLNDRELNEYYCGCNVEFGLIIVVSGPSLMIGNLWILCFSYILIVN